MRKIIFILILSGNYNLVFGQITFEKQIPFYNSIDAGEASKNGEFYFFIAENFLNKLSKEGNILNRIVTSSKLILCTDNKITLVEKFKLPNQSSESLKIIQLDYDLNVLNTWTYEYNRTFGEIIIQQLNNGDYVLFTRRTTTEFGTINDFKLFVTYINKNGVKTWETIVNDKIYSATQSILKSKIEDCFFILFNEFEYTESETITRGKIILFNKSGEIKKDISIDEAIILSGFESDFYTELVIRKNTELKVIRLDNQFQVANQITISNNINYNFTLPQHFIYEVNGGLSILGKSNGVQLPEGFFIFKTNTNYQITDSTFYYRGQLSSEIKGFFKTSDNGYLAFGTMVYKDEFSVLNPFSYLMKMDENHSTGFRPSFSLKEIKLNILGSDAPIFWIDYDNDKDLDLITINYFAMRLFRNNGLGKSFTEITDAFPNISNGTFVSIADYDNDGLDDIYVQRGYQTPDFNVMLQNKGNGTFTIDNDTGLSEDETIGWPCEWLDFNNDGYLDLYAPNKLYVNNGIGKFNMVFDEVIKNGELWYDINNDRYLDLLSLSTREIYINEGGINFAKQHLSNFIKFNDLSISPGNIYDWEVLSYNDEFKAKEIIVLGTNKNFVYQLNNEEIYAQTEFRDDIVYQNGPTSATLVDLDNNSLADIFFNGNGDNYAIYEQLLFNRSDSAAGFTYIRELPEAKRLFKSFSWIDFNEDGALDLAGIAGPDLDMLYSEKVKNHWIKVKLEGIASNPNGVNAKIKVKSNNKWQTKSIKASAGHNSTNEIEVHFGLGYYSKADSIIVNWPSGCYQIIKNVDSNQTILITENCSGENPIATWNSVICEGESVTIDIQSKGVKFKWFKSLLNNEPFTESSKQLKIDTLTKSVVFFVANADSTMLSRKIPVRINVYKKPNFDIKIDSLNSTTYAFSATSNNYIENYEWSINGDNFSNESSFEYEFNKSDLYNICLTASNPGCQTLVCKEIFLVVTNVNERLNPTFKVYPNPTEFYLTVCNETKKSFKVKVFDSDGNNVDIKTGTNLLEIDLSHYAAGIYFLLIESNVGENEVFKIIKR